MIANNNNQIIIYNGLMRIIKNNYNRVNMKYSILIIFKCTTKIIFTFIIIRWQTIISFKTGTQ